MIVAGGGGKVKPHSAFAPVTTPRRPTAQAEPARLAWLPCDCSPKMASSEPCRTTGPPTPMFPVSHSATCVVGVPNEIKTHESRVALTPVGVEELSRTGHKVLIQAGAGQGSGISDEKYQQHGAEIVPSAADVWARADLIVKVKEPLEVEWPLMRQGQVVFTYFHFAADEALTKAVMASGVTAVAYETIRDAKGTLPLLTPMSEVAGRMSIQEGAKYLERPFDGRGILLG